MDDFLKFVFKAIGYSIRSHSNEASNDWFQWQDMVLLIGVILVFTIIVVVLKAAIESGATSNQETE